MPRPLEGRSFRGRRRKDEEEEGGGGEWRKVLHREGGKRGGERGFLRVQPLKVGLPPWVSRHDGLGPALTSIVEVTGGVCSSLSPPAGSTVCQKRRQRPPADRAPHSRRLTGRRGHRGGRSGRRGRRLRSREDEGRTPSELTGGG